MEDNSSYVGCLSRVTGSLGTSSAPAAGSQPPGAGTGSPIIPGITYQTKHLLIYILYTWSQGAAGCRTLPTNLSGSHRRRPCSVDNIWWETETLLKRLHRFFRKTSKQPMNRASGYFRSMFNRMDNNNLLCRTSWTLDARYNFKTFIILPNWKYFLFLVAARKLASCILVQHYTRSSSLSMLRVMLLYICNYTYTHTIPEHIKTSAEIILPCNVTISFTYHILFVRLIDDLPYKTSTVWLLLGNSPSSWNRHNK